MQGFDVVLEEVGEFGLYQQLVMWLLCVAACFMNPYNGFQLVFLMYDPHHQCEIPKNFSLYMNITATECDLHYFSENSTVAAKVEKCQKWQYDTEFFESTMITKWNLVCDKAMYSKISLSILVVATVVGCSVYSYIQDRWGRKVAFHLTLVTYIFGGTVSLLMPNLLTFTIVRLFSAINCMSSWNISYIWALEYTGLSKRTTVTTIMCVMYGVGMVSMSLIAWLCRTWIQMGLACTVPFIALFSYHFIIMESPRWLLSQGRNEEAIQTIRKMLKWQRRKVNMKKVEELLEQLRNWSDSSSKLDDNNEANGAAPAMVNSKGSSLNEVQTTKIYDQNRLNVLDLFRGPTLRKKTLLLTFAWIANAVVYSSISFNTENLGENIYITWAILGFVEVPGCFLILLLNKVGRIFPISFLMVLSGVCCLLTAPSDYFSSTLVIVFALIGKFGISITYGVLYQLGSELFPTTIRGLGIGFASVVGDAGNIVMPYIIYSANAYKMLPMVIIGILALAAGVLTLFLPETLGQYMPETVEEAEEFGLVSCQTFIGHFKRSSRLASYTKSTLAVSQVSQEKAHEMSHQSISQHVNPPLEKDNPQHSNPCHVLVVHSIDKNE